MVTLVLDPEVDSLLSQVSADLDLSREETARIVLESALDVFRTAATGAVGCAASDPALARAARAWTADVDAALAAVDGTLDALDHVDRNALLSAVIDAWTAILEEPRLARLT